MRSLPGNNSKFNLKYAITEIILITCGILIAFSIESWNDNLKKEKIKLHTLQEIKEGLLKDKEDMEETMKGGYEYRLECYKIVLEVLNNERKYETSLNKYFLALMGSSLLISNTAPYETLKSRGLAIIDDDELRNMVATYYDTKLEWLLELEKDHHQHNINYVRPKIFEYYNFTSKKELKSLNLNSMKQDTIFKGSLMWSWKSEEDIYNIYKDIKADVSEIIKMIDSIK